MEASWTPGPGFIVLTIVGVVFLCLGFVVWRALKNVNTEGRSYQARKAALEAGLARARQGAARVVASDVLPHEVRDQHGFGAYREVTLTLEVADPAGAFRAQAYWDVQVTAMPEVAPEQSVSILIDASQSPPTIYPGAAWARARPQLS